MPPRNVNILAVDALAPAGTSTATDPLFVVQVFEKGPTDRLQEIKSVAQRATYLGDEVPYSVAPTAVDAAIAERTRRVIVSRVVGPAAKRSSLKLKDSTNADCLLVEAANEGEWGDKLMPAVIVAAGTFEIAIFDQDGDADEAIATTGPLTTLQAAVDVAAESDVFRVSRLAGQGLPVAKAATNLAGGTDDRDNITPADWGRALLRIRPQDGPGQLAAPGVGVQAVHTLVATRADATNKTYELDGPDGASVATLKALAASLRALGNPRNHRGALHARWVNVPSTAAGGTSAVPYSVMHAAQCARSDASGRLARAITYANGYCLTATGLRGSFSDEDLDELEAAGVTVAIVENGVVVTTSDLTLCDPQIDKEWRQLSAARYAMGLYARLGDEVAPKYRGLGPEAIPNLGVELVDLLDRDWRAKELYSPTGLADGAYTVDVGPDVNTEETIAALELNAEISFTPSPSNKSVTVKAVLRPLEA